MEEYTAAIKSGDLAQAMRYLQAGMDPDEFITYNGTRMPQLCVASLLGNVDLASGLIRAQVNVDLRSDNGESALSIASKRGHYKLALLLAEAQCDPDLKTAAGFSALHVASELGHHLVVSTLVKAKADLDIRDSNGRTPLCLASRQGHRPVTGILINAHADLNLHDEDGYTPLDAASEKGHRDIVEDLVLAQADVNGQQRAGEFPLYRACKQGHFEVADVLLRAQADVNLKTSGGTPGLFVALVRGNHQIADKLIRAPADVDLQQSEGGVPLHVAASKGHLAAVEALIEAQADVNVKGLMDRTPLCISSLLGYREVADLLIRAQGDVNAQDATGCTPLYMASQKGHRKLVDLLVSAGADVNLQDYDGLTPLHIATHLGFGDVVDGLIKARSEVNISDRNGVVPLYVASQNGHARIADALILAGAQVNMTQNEGASPLHVASECGHYGIASSLIKAQADVNLQATVGGFSPLHVASSCGHHQVVALLISAGADVDLREHSGQTALSLASENGYHLIVDACIKAQADVNVQDVRGYTPLYSASENGHDQTVEALIKAQADVNLQEENGCSPLYLASQEGYEEIAKLLIQAGAIVDLQNDDGCAALHLASLQGNPQIVDSLIEAQGNVDLQDDEGNSPLLFASISGNWEVVDSLLRAQADASLCSLERHSAMQMATQNGHQQVIRLLANALDSDADYPTLPIPADEPACKPSCASLLTDSDLSQQLHLALTEAGFESCTASLQSAVADVLQQILRRRSLNPDNDSIFVVGSFSEGWGNSLVCLNGKTDIESDIDVMELIPGRQYHLDKQCECDLVEDKLMQYINGHILCSGFASSPASAEPRKARRPAVDRVSACRLCCYPPIAPLQQPRVNQSNIPQPVLESLRQELRASPCHVVHAAAPGQAGKQLRVSTTFLEKRLLRSLSTLQGQLFVTLKYLVKKVICRRVQGVKAYHAKTVTFRLLEETPAEQWLPGNLVSLTRRALQMLHDSVESSCGPDNADGRVMDHFFLCDAALYLKGADRSSALDIAQAVGNVIEDLPQLLVQFKDSLRPLTGADKFYFHPFLIMPIIGPMPVSKSTDFSYHEVYDVIKETVVQLSLQDWKLQSFLGVIGRLPDSARSARGTLKALACLKFGCRDEARAALRDCSGHEVSKGIDMPPHAATATADFVWQQLKSCDSAWKFWFQFDQRPPLAFLPKQLADGFPGRWLGNEYYINFDALLKCLVLEMAPDESPEYRPWFENLLQQDDLDPQEMLAFVRYCSDWDLTCELIKEHPLVLREDEFLLEELMRRQKEVSESTAYRTDEEAVVEFEPVSSSS